jgi:CubicO group peptidase (beta-lactamase class C family)
MILQMLIERQTGRRFAAYMKDAVLTPLGMTSSSFDWGEGLQDRTATPYLQGERPMPLVIPQDTAADSLFSTAGDLARFIAAPLPDDQLPAGAGVLSPVVVDQIFLRPKINHRQAIALGPDSPCMGCFLEKAPDGPTMVSNGGYDPGWSCQIYMVPGTGDGLVILTNSSGGQPAIAQVAGIWTDWRGIPAPQITRSYRALGGYAVVIVGVTAFLAMAGGILALEGVIAGRRRFGAFHLVAIFDSSLEWVAGAVLISMWWFMRPFFQILPLFSAVSEALVIVLALVILTRTLFPRLPRPRRPVQPTPP